MFKVVIMAQFVPWSSIRKSSAKPGKVISAFALELITSSRNSLPIDPRIQFVSKKGENGCNRTKIERPPEGIKQFLRMPQNQNDQVSCFNPQIVEQTRIIIRLDAKI